MTSLVGISNACGGAHVLGEGGMAAVAGKV